MIGPIDEDPASQEAQVDRDRDPDDERRLKRRQQNRRYRESHSEQNAATRRRWVEANRDRVREYNRQWRAENLERARELNRESARRAARRMKEQAELRASARERAKRWRESHLDEVRKYQARWVEQNPEKVRGYSNDYYRTHREEINERAAGRRDVDPGSMRRARKAWAERNKDHLAELQRTRRSDPVVYQEQLEANAAARRLKRRLRNAGLPPKQLHTATAAERRANERAAALYFGDSDLSEHVRQADIFTEILAKHMLENGPQMRAFAESYSGTRARMGLPPVAVEDTIYARAVDYVLEHLDGVDLLTSRDVAAAVRSVKTTVRQEERKQQFELLVKAITRHVDVHRGRFEMEAEIENRARVRRGLPRVRIDALLVQIALRNIERQMTIDRLEVSDVQRACRTAMVRVIAPLEVSSSPASPVVDRSPTSKELLR